MAPVSSEQSTVYRSTLQKIGSDDENVVARQSQVFQMVDNDGDGVIDRDEFGKLYVTIKKELQEEHARELELEHKVVRQKRRIKVIGTIACVMMAFLGISVCVNAAVTFSLLEATKETSADGDRLVVKGTNTTVSVASADLAVAADGTIKSKDGLSVLSVASSDLTVSADGSITSKDGRSDLQVDTANHPSSYEGQEQLAELVRQLIVSSTTRKSLTNFEAATNDDMSVAANLIANDRRTVPLFATNGSSGTYGFSLPTTPDDYNLRFEVATFHTTHPQYPMLRVYRTSPYHPLGATALEMLSAEHFTAYAIDFLDSNASQLYSRIMHDSFDTLQDVAWESLMPTFDGVRRRQLSALTYQKAKVEKSKKAAKHQLKGKNDYFKQLRQEGKFKPTSLRVAPRKKLTRRMKESVWPVKVCDRRGKNCAFPPGKSYPSAEPPILGQRRRALSDRATDRKLQYNGESLEDMIAVWAADEGTDPAAAVELSESFCECWLNDWVPGDTTMSYTEWFSVQSEEPGGVDADGTAVGPGDAFEQFLEWLDAQTPIARRERQLAVRDALVHGRRMASDLSCPSNGGRYCHPSHSTLELETGASIRIDEVRVGERIRTPSGYEPVVGFLHAEKGATSDFFVFETASSSMAISEKHWLFVDGVEADPATARVGQVLDTVHGPQPILAIRKESHLGAYHLITPSGAYFVDGIAASTYPAYIPHAAWKLVGDAYVTMRYRLGMPVVPEGEAPVTLFWMLDALRAVGVSDALASAAFWPLIAATVIGTELASAAGAMLSSAASAAAPVGALTLALAATAPLARKARVA